MQTEESQPIDDRALTATLDTALASYERELSELETRRTYLRSRVKAIKIARKALTDEPAAADPQAEAKREKARQRTRERRAKQKAEREAAEASA